MSLVTVYAVFPTPAAAEKIGRAMVEAGLAACVNLLAPCLSFYRWQGKVERATETPALFKTTATRASALIAAIAAHHPHAVPAIVAWPADNALPAYAQWVTDETAISA